MAATTSLRKVSRVVEGMQLREGAGVLITRTVGTPMLRNLDPFLMLDEMRLPAAAASAGFPTHPHKGMQTLSIMLEGEMRHKDSLGNEGVVGPGGVQAMSAGRGIVHAEMPVTVNGGDLHGFQAWINLSAKDKQSRPRYQDVQADKIPAVKLEQQDSAPAGNGSRARVIAGRFLGADGPVAARTPVLVLDVTVADEEEVVLPIPSDYDGSFAYVYSGVGTIGGERATRGNALVLAPGGDAVAAKAGGTEALSFLLFAGKPIKEPIVQSGPFVMNSESEIAQAFADYHAGRLQNPDDDVWAADEL